MTSYNLELRSKIILFSTKMAYVSVFHDSNYETKIVTTVEVLPKMQFPLLVVPLKQQLA